MVMSSIIFWSFKMDSDSLDKVFLRIIVPIFLKHFYLALNF